MEARFKGDRPLHGILPNNKMPVYVNSHYPEPLELLRLRRAAQRILRTLGLADLELGILLVDNREITDINGRWLKRPWPTNVISFGQTPDGPDFDSGILGDIVISVDTARKEAADADSSLEKRLDALLIHGIVHLMGFDHTLGEQQSELMKKKERELLDILYKERIMADLCINVDHVATIRQARGGNEPDPVMAAGLVELAGADGVVVHLREDRRHIQDRDVRLLRQTVQTRLTLEMAATDEMLAIAAEIKPDIVTLVPERRQELTTEGGLDVARLGSGLKEAVARLHDSGIPVSLFVDPEEDQILASERTGADCIEIHTGRYAEAPDMNTQDMEFEQIVKIARLARDSGLRVHAGHGLNYRNTARLAVLEEIEEFSIGHSVVSRAVLVGLRNAVREMLALVKRGYIA